MNTPAPLLEKETVNTHLPLKIVLFLVVIIGGILVQRHYQSLPAKPKPVAQTPPAPAAQKTERMRNIEIEANLSRLARAQEKFLYLHPGKSAKFSDLVGPQKAIPAFSPSADEKYPEEFPPGLRLGATLHDGTVLEAHMVFNAMPRGPMPDIAAEWTREQYGVVDASMVFQALVYAGRIQHNLKRQQELQNVLRQKMTVHPASAALLQEMQNFLEDLTAPQPDRDLVFQAIKSTGTPESIRFLIKLATTSANKELRLAAGQHLGQDVHRQDTFMQVWCETNDERLLASVATPMAKRAEAKDIELLLNAVLSPDADPARIVIAEKALLEVISPYAEPVLTARLATLPPLDARGKTLAYLLTRLGTETAGKALISWIQTAEDDGTALIQTLGPIPKTPPLRAAWTAALDPTTIFHNEKNREAIRAHLAPAEVKNRLKNGSFEDGTAQGFSVEGSVNIIGSWAAINATDGQFMAYLDTANDPIAGRSTLTTGRFEVPAGMKTLLVDYNLMATSLLPNAPNVLECSIITDGATQLLPSLYSKNTLLNYQEISRFDQGTGFRTACISVEKWAGTGKLISVKFTLRGRGKLPDYIPGMGIFDANVAGHNQPGTALALDNFRLTEQRRTTPASAKAKFTIISTAADAIIKTTPGSFPKGATIHIWDGTKENTPDIEPNNPVVFVRPYFDEFENAAHFIVGYSILDGTDGPIYGEQCQLGVDRLPQETTR